MPPFGRGGFGRGRGRGRGDWGPDRGRGRVPYDDRGDRYPRSRSQEGRWGRDRDDRGPTDRYQEPDIRRESRDIRDDRDRIDRDGFRPKLDARMSNVSEPAPLSREVSPPPVAPSAPAFGSIPNRPSFSTDEKPPRTFGERPTSSSNSAHRAPSPTSSPGIPSGPRAHQQASSKQWINPHLKRGAESPTSAKSQLPESADRPRSSGANSDSKGATTTKRARSYSAEPGEITVKVEEEAASKRTERAKSEEPFKSGKPENLEKRERRSRSDKLKSGENGESGEKRKKKGKSIKIRGVRFSLPGKEAMPIEPPSESDDDEDMADYFDMEIRKTESELAKLERPKLPMGVLARFASITHGAMVKVLEEKEGLSDMIGKIPDGVTAPTPANNKQSAMDIDERRSSIERKIQEASETLKLPLSAAKGEVLDIAAVSADEDKIMADGPPVGGLKANTLIDDKLKVDQTEDERMSTPLPEKPEPESKPPSTPSQVADEDDTESEDDTYMDIEAVRQYMSTPKLDTLPNLAEDPWENDAEFLTTLQSDPIVDNFVAEHLEKIHLDKKMAEDKDRSIYSEKYLEYLDFTKSNDPAAIKARERYPTSVPPQEDIPTIAPEQPKEGRTSGRRFASERDLERVLQASMREDEERKERELRIQKEKYRSEKEAVIPDMYWNTEEKDEVQFTDRTGYVPQDRLVAAWEVLSPLDNFTSEETALFEKRYLENPKQWGRIADAVPERDFGTCIQYYYLMKKDLNLKEKLRKQPKRRKKGGRGKQRSSALMSELGNPDGEEENQETGENGERRRPRRAAAPTWGFEQPSTDNDATPASTPGRRGQSDKPDGRRGRKRQPKDKDAKGAKAKDSLAPPGGQKGRPKSNSRMQSVEFQPPPPGEGGLQAPFEQPGPPGIQPPFSVQPHPMHVMERQKGMQPSSISDVMAAPSLRPEPPPPPQSTVSTFNLSQDRDRKGPTAASSYWSVSESNDFPGLLRAFGSDWTAIANHMGSKTAVMVKNYFVRQKDQGKAEWDAFVQEADGKRMRGEKRPEPPQPSTGGGGRVRRYDTTPISTGQRPLAAAGGLEAPAGDPNAVNVEQGRGQQFTGYGVPIAQAPPQQQPLGPGQQPMGMQHPGQQPPPQQPVSPHIRPVRTPLQPYGFDPEREMGQRVPLPPKSGMVPELREQPPQMPRAEPMMDRQRAEMERERSIRAKQEADMAAQRAYEPYGHRQQPSMGQGRPDPMTMGRQPGPEPSRAYPPGPAPPPGPPGRGLLGDPGRAQSPGMGHRPVSAVPPPRPGPGEPYGAPLSQAGTPAPMGGPSRPPEPRKTSNIMSLLNDDSPPAPKRAPEVSATPPPQGLGRPAPPPPSGQPQGRREPEAHYSPYGRAPPAGASAMPSLKPSFAGSPRQQSMGTPRMGGEPPLAEQREYYRHAYPQQGSNTNSPQSTQRYAPSGQSPYQQAPAYAAPYGGSQPPPQMAGSPPPQYGNPRGREVDHGRRDAAWPPPGGAKHSPSAPPPQSWSPAPPSQLSMRDDRAYGSRYAPPPSRGQEVPPPQPQPYNRYSSTPVQPRDPREPPGRSYTPVGYDGRGPPPQHAPPPPGPGYPVDPRDHRDPRDPRMRQQGYDRPPDQYRR